MLRFLIYILWAVLFIGPTHNNFAETKPAPPFVAKEFGTTSFYSSKKQFGKGPVVISFWATWCGPCIKELRALKPYYKTLSKQGVQFLAISIDDSKTSSRINSVIKRYKLPYTVLLDPDKHIFKSFQGQYPPLTVLIDSNGNIVYKHHRYQKGDELVLIKNINRLLKNQSDKPTSKKLGASLSPKLLPKFLPKKNLNPVPSQDKK